MEAKGIVADDHTYQVVASRCHNTEEATKLLSIIKERNHSPNEFVWGTLCGMAAKSQQYSYLLYLLKVVMFC